MLLLLLLLKLLLLIFNLLQLLSGFDLRLLFALLSHLLPWKQEGRKAQRKGKKSEGGEGSTPVNEVTWRHWILNSWWHGAKKTLSLPHLLPERKLKIKCTFVFVLHLFDYEQLSHAGIGMWICVEDLTTRWWHKAFSSPYCCRLLTKPRRNDMTVNQFSLSSTFNTSTSLFSYT